MARGPFPGVSHGERCANISYLCPIMRQRHSLTSVTRSNSAFLLYAHYVFNMIQDGKGTFSRGFPQSKGPNISYLCPIMRQRHSLTSVTQSNSAFLLYAHYVFNMIQDGKGTFSLGFPW